MPYNPPSFKSLQNFVAKLPVIYTGTENAYLELVESCKKDPKHKKASRIQAIQLLQMVAAKCKTEDSRDILLGACEFVLKRISDGYSFLSPQHTSWVFFPTGSDLYTALRSELNLNDPKNSLDSCQKLILLDAFYQFVKKADINDVFPGYENHLNKDLADDIAKQMKEALIESRYEIDELLNKRFSTEFLKNTFALIPDCYKEVKTLAGKKQQDNELTALVEFKEKVKQKKSNQDAEPEYVKIDEFIVNERDKLVELLRLTNQVLYGFDNPESPAAAKAYADTIRYAAIVYAMSMIENTYKVFSAENSALYRLCQAAINLKSTTNLSPLDKFNCCTALLSFLPHLTQYTATREHFPGIEKFYSKMRGDLFRQQSQTYDEMENADPHPYIASMCNIINFMTQCGINLAIGTVAGSLVTIPASHRFLSRAAKELGRKYYGIPGAYMAEQVFITAETAAVTNVVAKALKTGTEVVSTAPGNIIYYTLTLPIDFANKVGELLLASPPKPNIHETQAYVKTLLALPDELLSADKKERLKHIQLSNLLQASLEKPAEERELHRMNSM